MQGYLILLCIPCLALSAMAGMGQSQKIFPFSYKRVQLENGFVAYMIKAGAPGQIAYTTVARVGAREEWEPGKSGYAHFFEHMMFRGTEKYPDYDGITSKMGAARNASTSSDVTQYYLVTSSEDLEKVIDLESDRFMNLKYTEAQFKTEAGAVLGEFNQGRANPMLFLYEKIADTAFDRHTYKHLTIGFEADVRSMPEGYEYSRSFYQRYYRPENCVLLLAGDFDFAQAERWIRHYYGPWRPGYVAPRIEPEPPQTAPKQTTVEFPGRTLPILAVNYKGPAWSATNKLAVATEVLGLVAFGPNSEIYKKLVIQDQKVQWFNGDFDLSRDPGLLSILTMVNQPEDLPQIKQEIRGVAQKFSTELCDAKFLQDTKSALKYGFLMSLETAQGVDFALRPFVVFTGGIEALEDYYRTLEAVTPQDVQAAARQFLVEIGRTTVTLMPAPEVKK